MRIDSNGFNQTTIFRVDSIFLHFFNFTFYKSFLKSILLIVLFWWFFFSFFYQYHQCLSLKHSNVQPIILNYTHNFSKKIFREKKNKHTFWFFFSLIILKKKMFNRILMTFWLNLVKRKKKLNSVIQKLKFYIVYGAT